MAVSWVVFGADSIVRFEPNRGQSAAEVRFLSSGGQSTVFLTDTETVYRSSDGAVRWTYPGAAPARFESRRPDSHTRGYRRGRDASKWVDGVPTFLEVVRKGVWPGIDIVYHGDEYDFVVQPGADPSRIRIRFASGTKALIAPDGSLHASYGDAKYRHRIPSAYTNRDGARAEVRARFRRIGPREFGVAVGGYDRSAVLTIDPEVRAFTRVGGRGNDELMSITGAATWVGTTTSPEFPAAGTRGNGDRDIVLVAGSESVVIGGSGDDIVHGFFGNYVVGETTSRDLPVSWTDPRSLSFRTSAPPQEIYGGGASDGFVLVVALQFNRFSFAGLTYWGGSGTDRLKAARSGGSSVFFAGESDSTDLIGARTAGEFNRGKIDVALVTALFLDQTTQLFLFAAPRLFGGSGDDSVSSMVSTVVNGVTTIHVLGETESPELGINGPTDGLWISFAAAGYSPTSPVGIRTVGGSGRDRLLTLALADRQLLLAGDTTSPDIPDPSGTSRNHGGGWDWLLLALDADTGTIRRRTFFGGSGDERLRGIHVTGDGSVALVGSTDSRDLPVRKAFQETYGGGVSDGAFARVDPAGGVVIATYLGGEGRDEAISVCAACTDGFLTFRLTPQTGSPTIFGVTDSIDWKLQTPTGPAMAPFGGVDAFAISLPIDQQTNEGAVYTARDIPGGLTIAGPAGNTERIEARLTSEDPALVQIATASGLAQGGASATVPLLTQAPRTGNAVLLSNGVEGETYVRVEVPGLPVSRFRAVAATARIAARLTPAAQSYIEGAQYSIQLLVEFLRNGSVVSEATTFPVPLQWRIQSLTPEIAVASFEEQFGTAFLEPMSLTIRSAGTARFRVTMPGTDVEAYEFSVPIEAGRMSTIRESFVPGLSTGIITITGPPRQVDRTVKVTSSNPDVIAVGRTSALVPAPSASIDLIISAGQSRTFFFVHGLRNEGQTTLSIAAAGESSFEVPLQIAPAVAVFAPIAGTEVGVNGVANLPIAVSYVNPTTGEPAFPPNRSATLRGNVRIDMKLGVGDETTAVLSTKDGFLTATNSGAPSVRGVAAGTTTAEILEATNIRVDPARARHEVRVRGSREWRPRTVVVGEQLFQEATFSLPFESADLVRGFSITSEAPLIAGMLPSSLQPAATQNLPGPSPNFTIRVAGIAAGETTLRIEVTGKEPLRIPVRVTKTTAHFALREQSIAGWQGPAPVAVRFAVFDESTGQPGPVQERWMRTVLPGFGVTGDPSIVRVAAANPAQPSLFTVTPLKAGQTELRIVYGEVLRSVETGSTLPVTINKQPLNLSPVTVGARFQTEFSMPNGASSVTLRSSDPSRLVLSASENERGGETIVLRQGRPIYLQAIGGTGVVRVLVDAGDCCEASDLLVEVVQPKWEWAEESSGRSLDEPYDLVPRAVRTLRLFTRTYGRPLPLSGDMAVSFRSSDDDVAIVSRGPIRLSYATGFPSADFAVQSGRLGSATISAVMPDGMQPPRPLRVRVPAPKIRLLDLTLSRDAQRSLTINQSELSFPLPAPLAVTFTSLDPSKLLLSANATVPGSAAVTVRITQTAMAIPDVFAQALAGEGSVRVRVTADGYETTEATVTFDKSVYIDLSRLSPSALDIVRGATRDYGLVYVNQNSSPQPIRPGVQIPVRLVSSNPSAVRVREQQAFLSQSQAEAKFQIEAVGLGSGELKIENDAGLANRFQSTIPFRVRAGQLTASVSDRYLPQYMTRQIRVAIPLPAGSRDSIALTATSLTPSLLSVSATEASAASATAVVEPPPGAVGVSFVVHALAPAGLGRIRISSDTFDSTEIDVTLIRPSLGLFSFSGGNPLVVPSTGGPIGLNIVLGGELNSSFYSSPDINLSSTRSAITPIVQSTNPAAGSLSTPSPLGGAAQAASITFTPAAPGQTTLTVQQPSGFVAVPGSASVLVRVDPVAGSLFSAPAEIDVAQYLAKTAVFSAAFPQMPNEAPIPVTLSSSDAARLLVSAEASATAGATAQINARPGAPTIFRVTGLAGQGTAQVTFSAPGFVPRTMEVRFAPSGLAFPTSVSAPVNPRLNESFTLNASWFRLDRSTRALVEATGYGVGIPIRQPSVLIANPNVLAVDGSHALTGEGVQFRLKAIGRGTSDVTIVQPPGFTEPASGTTIRVTVP